MTKRTRYFVFGSVTVLLVGLCTGLVAYYTGMPMGAFGQTSALPELRYVPGNAAVVAYADVRNVMQSELRQKLHKANTGESHEDGQAEFQKHTGIDIESRSSCDCDCRAGMIARDHHDADASLRALGERGRNVCA